MRGCGIAHLEHSEHRWGGQARRIRRLCHFLAFAAQLFWPRGSISAVLGAPENGPKWVIYTEKTAILDFGRFGAFADSASGARRFHRPAEVGLRALRFRTTYCTCHLKLYSRFYAVGKLAVFWAPQNRPLRPNSAKLAKSAKFGQNGQNWPKSDFALMRFRRARPTRAAQPGCGSGPRGHYGVPGGARSARTRRIFVLSHFRLPAKADFPPRTPRKSAKFGHLYSKNGDFRFRPFWRLRRFCQWCPAVPPACGS